MTPRVKVCGITNINDALFCAHAGAEYLGFIFYRKSPRAIETAKAHEIIRQLPKSTVPVGVFVNSSRIDIEHTIGSTGIRLLQLSGDEPPEECTGYTIPVWKAFRFNEPGQVEAVGRYSIDAALLEGAADGQYGGSGHLPDLSIALLMKESIPLVLAGGISPDNVQPTVSAVGPYAIDVNSGVELHPGKKDHKKVLRLFENLSSLNAKQ